MYTPQRREVPRIRSALAALAIIATLTPPGLKTYDAELKQMHTTAYCIGTTTATGTQVREGVAAVDREHIGWVAVVYEDNDGEPGKLIGLYNCEDTGKGGDADGDGIGSIEAGQCIDIYRRNLDRCKEWMKDTGGKCWVRYYRQEDIGR